MVADCNPDRAFRGAGAMGEPFLLSAHILGEARWSMLSSGRSVFRACPRGRGDFSSAEVAANATSGVARGPKDPALRRASVQSHTFLFSSELHDLFGGLVSDASNHQCR